MMAILGYAAGAVSDMLIRRGVSITSTRKIMQVLHMVAYSLVNFEDALELKINTLMEKCFLYLVDVTTIIILVNLIFFSTVFLSCSSRHLFHSLMKKVVN